MVKYSVYKRMRWKSRHLSISSHAPQCSYSIDVIGKSVIWAFEFMNSSTDGAVNLLKICDPMRMLQRMTRKENMNG